MIHTLIPVAAVALALQQPAMVTSELSAQGNGGPAGPTNPTRALVTEKEVEAAIGLDYDPGPAIEAQYESTPRGDELHVGRPGAG